MKIALSLFDNFRKIYYNKFFRGKIIKWKKIFKSMSMK